MSVQDVIDATANPLRDYSTKQVEAAISKALSELTGRSIITKIGPIDFKSEREGRISSRDAFLELWIDEDRPNPF